MIPGAGGQPIFILKDGTERTHGRTAESNNIAGARAVADAVRSTLGPMGRDKMLVDPAGNMTITNDGVSILREIDVQHPSAKMVVEVAKSQEEKCYDGTTTAVVLAGELLRVAEEMLVKGVHPTTICKGYERACDMATGKLRQVSDAIKKKDKGARYKQTALTALNGKTAEGIGESLASLCCEAVSFNKNRDGGDGVDLDMIRVVKSIGDGTAETSLFDGLVLEKAWANSEGRSVTASSVLLLGCAIERKEIGQNITVSNAEEIERIMGIEESAIREQVATIHESGAQAVFVQKKVDDLALHYLTKHGILVAQMVKKSDLQLLSTLSGATIVSDVSDVTSESLGDTGQIKTVKHGPNEVLYIPHESPKFHTGITTVVVTGSTNHVVDEIERAVDDCLGVVSLLGDGQDEFIIPGAGSAEMIASNWLTDESREWDISGRELMAIQKFAEALQIIPATIAENAGLDPIDVIPELIRIHAQTKGDGFSDTGVNATRKQGEDMVIGALGLGIVQPVKVSTQAIRSATEVAVMILRIDDVISMKGGGGPPPPNFGSTE
jgi:chaperonin GroEL (HSP60 family)